MGKNQSKHEDIVVAQTAGNAQASQHGVTTTDMLLIFVLAIILFIIISYIVKKWHGYCLKALRREIQSASINNV